MPPLAEIAGPELVLLWAGAVGGTVTTVGTAAVGLYFLFRKKQAAARKDDAEAQAAALDADNAPLRAIIDDLRVNEAKMREAYSLLQAGVVERLMRANDLHTESEKKRAAIEERLRHTEDQLGQTQKTLRAAERRIKELEDRSENDAPVT